MDTMTKTEPHTRDLYLRDVITLSSINFLDGSKGICQKVEPTLYPSARAQLIRDKKLAPETGKQWLIEFLEGMAEELKTLPEDELWQIWDSDKGMLSHFEAIMWPDDCDLVDQKELHIYDALNEFEAQYNKVNPQ